ncbi:MAG: SDR family NAD(P)-dependent oxidoreductase [Hyphomicrobiaceae bacterium]
MQRLGGKIAIVTGAAHGIGGAIADRLAADGAKVLAADIEFDAAEARSAAIRAAGGEAIGLKVDVRERGDTEAMVARAVAEWGRLDILVSNAGITDRQPFLEMDDALWHRVMATNLYGTFTGGQAAARQMVRQGEGGRIVHVASNSGVFGGRGRAAYGASKAGIINLTQTMAIELAEHGILVNAVAPGATRTRVTGDGDPPETVMARMPLRRFGEPSEIAAVAAFLASDECSFTTGHVYCADGGFTVAGVMEG